jgi:hypothetical protein
VREVVRHDPRLTRGPCLAFSAQFLHPAGPLIAALSDKHGDTPSLDTGSFNYTHCRHEPISFQFLKNRIAWDGANERGSLVKISEKMGP